MLQGDAIDIVLAFIYLLTLNMFINKLEVWNFKNLVLFSNKN